MDLLNDEKQVSSGSPQIPEGVLFPPGAEPENIRKRLTSLFEKLDSAYPDKRIIALHKDHKKWGEALTSLYRQLGYLDGNSLLVAYGYEPVEQKGGRPSGNPLATIEELKKRYAQGPTCTQVDDLFAENPDLEPKIATLRKDCKKLFGMTFSQFLIKQGLLVGTPEDEYGSELQKLKDRYAENPFCGTLAELMAKESDIDWSIINKYYKQQRTADTFKVYLEKEGIFVDADTLSAAKLQSVTEELKKRYPQPFCGPIGKLKADNEDLPIGSMLAWTMKFHNQTVAAYLIAQGIMAQEKTPAEKLAEIIDLLKGRYASKEKKAYDLNQLKAQNPDVEIGSIDYLTRKLFHKAASTYLSEQGILSRYDWAAAMAQRAAQREAEAAAAEARIQAGLAQPIEPTYYEPPVYHVEEISVTGEEAAEWQWKDTYFRCEGEVILDDYIGDKRHIVVPTYINGRRVMGYGPACFSKCKAEIIELPGSIPRVGGSNGYGNVNIREVIVGEGVTSIGQSFLSAAKNIASVKVSKGVQLRGITSDLDIPFSRTEWFNAQNGPVILGDTLVGANGDDIVLVIPNGVKKISANLSIKMPYLRKVVIPESVTEIGADAFSHYAARKIREFVIPDTLKKIGARAFGGTEWIERIKEDPIVINGSLYSSKDSRTETIIPDDVVAVCGEAFKGRDAIKKVQFPASLREIGAEAFCSCRSLSEIKWNEGLRELGIYAFSECVKLIDVSLPQSLERIGAKAFSRCDEMKKVTFGASLSDVGEGAFYNCNALERVEMNDGLKRIGEEAFQRCFALSEVSVPNTVEEVGASAFESCEKLESVKISEKVKQIKERTFYGCKALSRITLHDEVEAVERQAFAYCGELTEIDLPINVGAEAFINCPKLKRVSFKEGIKVIEKRAFQRGKALEEIILPEGVEMIEEGAFSECDALKRIVLPKSLKRIGANAFFACRSLRSVVIPAEVSEIGDCAFKDCNMLEEVSIGGTPRLGIDAFTNTPYQKNKYGDFFIEAGVLVKYLGASKEVVIPSTVQCIGENAFAEAKQVTSITIPDTVKTISARVFGANQYGDQGFSLQKLSIGSGVSVIGEEAFANCRKLAELTIGSNVTEIQKEAFAKCERIERIDLGGTKVKTIGDAAFSDCKSVKKFVPSDCLERVGEYAFNNCRLGVVKLPKTVKTVESSAFCGTKELVVYDTIDPDAQEAKDFTFDRWNGSINSSLSCALHGAYRGFVECQGNMTWNSTHITVLSSETEKIRYRIYCDSEERDAYRVINYSGWGKNASFRFEAYDAYFQSTRSLSGRTEMAFCRVMYPEGLKEVYRLLYVAYLERCLYIERSARRTASLIGAEDALNRLKLLFDLKAIDKRNIAWIRDELKRKNATACLAYLDQQFSK